MIRLVKIVGTAAVLSGFAMPLAVAEDTNGTEHNTHIGCYASVTNQCNGAGGCSEEDYNWGLDQCDSMYGQASIQRPPFNLNFKAKTTRGKNVILR
jgi:predicted TIM-barrel enzyme